MKKRFFAALLALAMVVVLLPATAKAAAPTAVYVGSTNVTTGYETERSLYGGRVRYSAGVLTLSGVTVPATATNSYIAAIYANGDLTIDLTNPNSVTAPATVTGESSGVRVENGSLRIQGTGSLTARGGNTTDYIRSYGAYIDGNLTITGGTLTGNGGISPEGNSYGVCVDNNIEVTGGALSGTSSTAGTNSFGVRAASIAVSGTGTLTGRSDSGNDCTGVLAYTSITVTSGAQLTGHGGVASNRSRGINCTDGWNVGSITLTGGVTTASGNTLAVNVQPNFGTPPANTWYRWKEHTTTSEPTTAYKISSDTNQFSNTSAKYLKVTPLALSISVAPDTAFPVGISGGDRTVVVGHGTGLDESEIGALSVGRSTLREGTDYTKANSASVDITLTESWLNSLPAGTHRLNVPVTSGAYAPQTPYINIVVTGTGADVPKTGDGSMPGLWAGLALLAGAGLLVLKKRRRA